MRKIESFPWWNDLLLLKDKYSLRELADRFDVTPGAITAAFKRTSTSRKSAPPGPRNRRTPVQEVLPPEPGEVAAPEVVEVAAPETRPGSKDGKLSDLHAILGKVPDSEVARKAGVSVRTVAGYRARKGIAGYAGPRRRGADRKPRKSRIDLHADLVGTVPDRVVAEKAGVSVNAVRNWRVKRGVSARRRPAVGVPAPAVVAAPAVASTLAAKPASTPVAAPAAPQAASGRGAWKMIAGTGGERVVRVIVADSLSAAAVRAEAAGLGAVLALEWIAEVV
jgi:hypothetical protein